MRAGGAAPWCREAPGSVWSRVGAPSLKSRRGGIRREITVGSAATTVSAAGALARRRVL